MKKTVIELPQVVETEYNGSERKGVLEYSLNGKILSKEESDVVLQQWVDHIKKVVPDSEIDTRVWVEWLESPHEKATANRNTLIKQFAMAGKQAPTDMLESASERIDVVDQSMGGQFKVQLLGAEWFIKDPEGDTVRISQIELRFYGNRPVACVWYCEKNGDTPDWEEYSWSEGVQKYLENGKKWLQKYAPQMEIPLPS